MNEDALQQAGAETIHPGRVLALGGTVPLDDRVSWVAPGAGGHAPITSYLVVDGDRAVLLDTGVPAVAGPLLRQLRALVAGGIRLSVLLTRQQEFDSVANLAAILRELPVETVWLRGAAKHSDNLDSVFGVVPDGTLVDFRSIGVADPVPVGDRIELEILAPRLRLLSTNWAYESTTRTLFTSDSFGHVHLRRPDESRVADDASEVTGGGAGVGSTYEDARRHLFRKFDYLPHADTVPIRDQLDEVFETHDVEVIAPMHGKALVGRAVVERHLGYVRKALAEAVR